MVRKICLYISESCFLCSRKNIWKRTVPSTCHEWHWPIEGKSPTERLHELLSAVESVRLDSVCIHVLRITMQN
jgi:hypothetical protein